MLSLVVPVYNGEENLNQLFSRIANVIPESDPEWELVFVDDCSTDASLSIIKALSLKNSNIVWLSFKQNRGQQIAVLCGLRESRGDMVITLDDDLEHPVEVIGALVSELHKGFDAVYAVPESSSSGGGRLRDLFFTMTLKKPVGLRIGSYRIFTRKAVDRIAEADQPFVYISAELFKHDLYAGSIRYIQMNTTSPGGSSSSSRYSFKSRIKLYLRLIKWYSPIIGACARAAARKYPRPQYIIAERGGRP